MMKGEVTAVAAVNQESAGLSQRDRFAVYLLIILSSCGLLIGRILGLQPTDNSGRPPFFSANDRSRWSHIRAFGDEGKHEIDDVIIGPNGKFGPWNSIDKVVHRGEDGREHYYSSKPPLFSMMVAYEYRLLKWITGWRFGERDYPIVRTLLITTNVIPFAIFLLTIAFLAERLAQQNWTRFIVVGVAGFGTFASTFAISLNNHLPAIVSTSVVLLALVKIIRDGDLQRRWFIVAGFFGAFAVVNELPALSLAAAAGALVLWKSPVKFLSGFVPAAALVALAYWGTNWQAHQSLRPPYAHREDGAVVATIEEDLVAELEQGRLPASLREKIVSLEKELGFLLSNDSYIEKGEYAVPEGVKRWKILDPATGQKLAVRKTGEGPIEIRLWDNWYEYTGSYWLADSQKRSKVDRGENSVALYVLHMTVGHHGIFSLTPIWLLSIAGCLLALTQPSYRLRLLAAMTLVLFVVCFGFYASRPLIDRNYGGQSCALRWMLWFIPIYLVLLIPALDKLSQNKIGKWLTGTLVLASIISASMTVNNPWVHPWIYQWFYME